MKRTFLVLAILTLVVPAVANAQTLNIRNGNAQALGQIVSRVLSGLTSVPYQNRYFAPQIQRRSPAPAYSAGYQNGYAQGLAAAQSAARYAPYGVNSGYWNQYPQNFGSGYYSNRFSGNRYNGFQRNARGPWRDND